MRPATALSATPHPMRWLAAIALPLLVSVCVDGVTPVVQGPALQLALAPTLAEGLSAEGSLPINRVRITAILLPSEDTLSVSVHDVDPAAASWTLSFEVPVREDLINPRFYVILELANVSRGVETVEWSGRSAALPLDLTRVPEIREVPVVRGPVVNLGVTAVAIAEHVDRVLEGDSVSLVALATAASPDDRPVVYWASANPAVATVSSTGVARAVGPGEAKLVAIAGPKADTTTLGVAARPVAVALSPASVRLRSLDEETTLTAAVVDVRGAPVEGESVRWAIDDESVVENLGGGRFRAVAPGQAVVSAHSVNDVALTASATLLVAPVPAKIQVSPAEAYLTAPGDQAGFRATGWDGNGHPVPDAAYAWTSLDPSVATVDGNGLVTAAGSGVARIVAHTELGADTVLVTVGMNLVAVVVSPSEVSMTLLGQGAQLTAVAVAASGAAIPSITQFSWSSDNPQVARVDSEGLVTSTGDGTARVMAQVGGVQGTATVTVSRTVGTVALTPTAHTLSRFGETVQMVAQARDGAGAPMSAAATWTSSEPGVATVDDQGLVTAVADGQTQVQVVMGGVAASSIITVDMPAPTLTVAPDEVVLTALGAVGTLAARIQDASGAPSPEVTFSWEVSPASTASLREVGLGTVEVTALAAGEATVTVAATRRGYPLTASARVVVRQVVDSVALDPPTRRFVSRGETQAFTARAFDGNRNPVALEGAVVWSSSDDNVVTVDASGIATAVDDGSAFIQAMVGGAQGRAAVTVARQVARVVIMRDAPGPLTFVGETLRLSVAAADAGGYSVAAEAAWRSADPGVATVNAEGLVVAVADGTARIIATAGTVSDTVLVEVRRAIATIRVTPASASLHTQGETLPFVATAFDKGGTPIPSVTGFAWASSDIAVATVAPDGVVTAVGDGTATITVTAAGVEATASVLVGIELVRIDVTPTSHTFVSEGEERRLSATAFDGGGSPVNSVTTFIWRSSDPTVVTVDATGLVTAVGDGSATVTAESGGISGAASMTVSRQIAQVTITPASPPTLVYHGQQVALSAQATDASGSPLFVPVTWQSLAPGVATVGADGLVTAVSNGTAKVVASAGGMTDTVTVSVTQEVSFITVTPRTRTFTAVAEPQSFTAVAYDASGTRVGSVTSFTWVSSAPGVAGVAPASGASTVATSVGAGSATISATAEGVTGTATVRVSLQAASLTISPSAPTSLTYLGETLDLSAAVRDVLGNLMASPVSWTSLDPAVATVGPAGTVTAVSNGSARIVATDGTVADTVTVPVAQKANFVSVSPPTRTFASLNQKQSFTATAFDAGGTLLAPAPAFTWTTGNAAVATVDGSGTVTAKGEGTTTVKASVPGAEGSAVVSVSRDVASVEVTPATATLASKGATQTYAAVAKDALGNVVASVTSFTWSSSNNSVATVNGSGVATAVGDGTATITASAGGVSGTAGVTVTRAVSSVVVTAPKTTFTALGETSTYTAVAKDANGNDISSVTNFTWASTGSVAAGTTSGVVTAASVGTGTVTASAGGATSAPVNVTVTQAVSSVVVTAPKTAFAALGETSTYTAKAKDANGNDIAAVTDFTWASSGSVTVGPTTGLVTAASMGAGTVTATANGVSSPAVNVTVGQEVSSVVVTAPKTTFTSLGETSTYTAVAKDANGNDIPTVTTFSWTSTGAVSVGGTTGVVTAAATGTGSVTATASGVSSSPVSVTVGQSVSSVVVTAPKTTFTSLGETSPYTAIAKDANGNDIPSVTAFTWSASGSVNVDAAGIVAAASNGAGTVTATATASGVTSSPVNVTVAQVVTNVTVTPGSRGFTTIGETHQFAAVAKDARGVAVTPAPTFTWASSDASVASVTSGGLGEAVAANGAATFTATAGGVSGTASVTVGIAVATIEVTPATASLTSRGETRAFTAVAKDAGGTVIPSVTSFSWSSSDPNVAAMDGSSGVATAVDDGTATIKASAGGVDGAASITVARAVSSVVVTAPKTTFTALGETSTYAAVARDANGHDMPSVTGFAWASTGSVTVGSTTGVVTAASVGAGTVTATASGVPSSPVSVTVVQTLANVEVTAPKTTFTALNETSTYTAVAKDANGNVIPSVTSFAWTSTGSVSVGSTSGVVTAASVGSGTVTATAGGVASSPVNVTVRQIVSSVEMTAPKTAFTALDETSTYTAVAKDANGNVIPTVTSFAWTSTGSVSVGPATGVVTAVSTGPGSVTAAADGVSSAPVNVTVGQTVSSVVVTAPKTAFTALNETSTYTALAKDANGNDIPTVTSFTWASTGSVNVDAAGVVTAASNGPGTVTATASGVSSAAVDVTVSQVVARIDVAPGTVSLTATGQTQPLTAAAFDAGGSALTPAPTFTWASSDTGVATVDAAGLVTAVADGDATVRATAGGVDGLAFVHVERSVVSVTISPDPPATLTSLGGTVQLTAAVSGGEGTVTWASLEPTVATVDADGLVTARSNGTARIVATAENKADTVTVTVAQAVSSVVVTPASVAVTQGSTLQLTATAKDAGGSTVEGVTFTWTVSPAGVASVDASGLLSATADGSTTVTAAAGAVSGNATVTVTSGSVIRTFSGGSSGDLLDPANWVPSGVPGPTDALVIPAGTEPVLTGNFEIGTLTLEAGATLDIGGFNLTVSGDLVSGGTIVGTGTVEMSGTGVSITGTVPNLLISGSVTVSGGVTVNGDMETVSGSTLTMTDSDATLDINGDLRLAGVTAGTLTDGVIYLAGELVSITNSFKVFNADGNHTVVFNGTTQQSVQLEFPGERQNRFQNIIVDNPSGIVFKSDIPILGNATLLQGFVESDPVRSTLVWAYGNISDDVGGAWRPDSTIVMGAAPSLPDSMVTHVRFGTATSLQSSTVVNGGVILTGVASRLTLNGQDLTVTGGLTVTDRAVLTLSNASDDLRVKGGASFNGASTTASLTAGRIWFGGDLTWINKAESYAPSGTQSIFDGTTLQQLASKGGGKAIHGLRIAAGANVTMTDNITVNGDMAIDAGASFTIPAGKTLNIVGTLTNNGTLVNNGTLIGG